MCKVLQKINPERYRLVLCGDCRLAQGMKFKLRSEGHVRDSWAEGPEHSPIVGIVLGKWEGERELVLS